MATVETTEFLYRWSGEEKSVQKRLEWGWEVRLGNSPVTWHCITGTSLLLLRSYAWGGGAGGPEGTHKWRILKGVVLNMLN